MEVKLVSLQVFLLLIGYNVLRLVASDSISSQSGTVQLVASKNEDCKASCPSDWIIGPEKSKCFRYIRSNLSWDDSETHCRGFGGNLAAFTSYEEQNSVQKLCGETAK